MNHFTVYEDVLGSWVHVPLFDNLNPDFRVADSSNIESYKLYNGRMVHHIPEYPVGEETLTMNFRWCEIDEKVKWESLRGVRIKIEFTYYTDKKKLSWTTESFELLVDSAVATPRKKTVKQIFDIEVKGIFKTDRTYVSESASKTLLLLHFDGDFKDSSYYGNQVKVGTPTINSVNVEFGSGAAQFNGVGIGIQIVQPVEILKIGYGDFTIEGWFNKDNTNSYPAYWIFYLDSDNYIQFFYYKSIGQFRVRLCVDGSLSYIYEENAFFPISYIHFAFVRKDGEARIFLDGSPSTLWKDFQCDLGMFNADLFIGCKPNGSVDEQFIGLIDEFRISNVARYETSFTVPTSPFNPVEST